MKTEEEIIEEIERLEIDLKIAIGHNANELAYSYTTTIKALEWVLEE